MTLQTENRVENAAPAETYANPPPGTALERGLFQAMDELRARHGVAVGLKQRVIHGLAALLAGLLLFGALYTVILFLE